MFVWRQRQGKREFLVLHRPLQKDHVVLTGHLEKGEILIEAAAREVKEELGVAPKNIVDLQFKVKVKIKGGQVLSEEHGFLLEIPYQEIKFLEYVAEVCWYPLEELASILTYLNQSKAVPLIEKQFEA